MCGASGLDELPEPLVGFYEAYSNHFDHGISWRRRSGARARCRGYWLPEPSL